MTLHNNILSFSTAITVSQKQVSELVGVSTQTVHNWTKAGKLHPAIVGSRKLYDLDEVNALIRPRNKYSKSIYLMVNDPETLLEQLTQAVTDKLREKQQ